MAEQWQVVSQRPTVEMGPDGRFWEVMEVTFRVANSRTTGTVRVPMERYTADEVRRLIDERVRTLLDVENL